MGSVPQVFKSITLLQSNNNLYLRMSWQQYVESQMIEKKLKKGAIAGLDGNIWAKSSDFEVTAAEVRSLLDSYEDPSKMSSTGIVLAGQKYFYLSGDEKVVRGKQGKGGVHLMRTKQTLLIGVYDEPLTPPEAANITESLGDYLSNCGY